MGGAMWDPDLRLSLGRSADTQSSSAPADQADSSAWRNGVEEPSTATSTRHMHPQKSEQQQQQQITIFYNGQLCVCDVTEIQAKSIISMAKQEADAMVEKNSTRVQHQEQRRRPIQSPSPHGAVVASPSSSSPALPQLQFNPSALSMKRSLQRFLEKRKTRADDASPYSHRRPFFFPIKS